MEQLTFDIATARLDCPAPGTTCDLTFGSPAATALIRGTTRQMESLAQGILNALDRITDPAPGSPALARYAGWQVPVALAMEAQSVQDGHLLLHFVSAHHGHLRVVLTPALIDSVVQEISNPRDPSDLN